MWFRTDIALSFSSNTPLTFYILTFLSKVSPPLPSHRNIYFRLRYGFTTTGFSAFSFYVTSWETGCLSNRNYIRSVGREKKVERKPGDRIIARFRGKTFGARLTIVALQKSREFGVPNKPLIAWGGGGGVALANFILISIIMRIAHAFARSHWLSRVTNVMQCVSRRQSLESIPFRANKY